MSAPQTKVTVFLRDKPLLTQTLSPGTYILGSGADAEIRFRAEGVADQHARLKLDDVEWEIEDLGSGNGTFVDEEQIRRATSVQPDQKIRLGEAHVILDSMGDTSAADATEVKVRRTLNAEMRDGRNYTVGRTVAHGGMGVIKSAIESTLQREVAMKLIRDDSKSAAFDRFCQEAQVTAQLEHPNIVPVHELGINQDGKPFYTMKLVRGVSLKRVLELLDAGDAETIRKWPLSALLTVFQKICDALAFAHSKGVIHRDLKPANIMLGEYGEALVMDWGLAKLLGREQHRTGKHKPQPQPSPEEETHQPSDAEATTIGPTISGTVMGTSQYMPPEQANGEVELMDERTDIYSLGAILYFVITLRPPFHGRSNAEVIQNVRSGNIVPFAEACGKKRHGHWPGGRLPESLAAVALKAMSFEKANRYPTVKALQTEIQAYQNGFATSAENASAVKILGLFLRRHRTISSAAALLLLAGVIFSIYLYRARDRAEKASIQASIARDLADKQRDVAESELYLSDMLQAGRQLSDGHSETARQLLQRHHHEPSGRNLREWEWYYLMGQASQDRLRIKAHTGGVFALCANADGTRLATGGADGEIALWQTRGLVPQWRVQAHPGGVLAVSWSPDGKYIASGGQDGYVRIWDIDAHKSVAEVRIGIGNPVRTVAWRPNDGGTPTLAIGSLEKELLIWHPLGDGNAGRPETFAVTQHGVASLNWSADGARLAAGETDAKNTLEVFDFNSRSAFSIAAGSGNDIFAVAIDPTGKYVAAGSKHLTVSVYEIGKKDRLYNFTTHHGFISAVAWRPEGSQIASASHDGTIRIDTLSSSNVSEVLNGHSGEVNALAWIKLPATDGNPSPMVLFSGGSDGTLRAWLPSSTEDTAIKVKPSNWVSAALWDPTGSRIAVVNFQDRVFLVDPVSGLAQAAHSTHSNLFDVAWSPDGTRLATASRGWGLVEILDTASGCPLGEYALPRAVRVAWSPSGRYLAGAGLDETRIWDTRNGILVTTILRPTKSLVWFPDETRIALGGTDGAIQVWDAFAGTILSTWKTASAAPVGGAVSEYEPPHAIFDMRWSPGGHYLAYGAQDGLADILDGATGHLIRQLHGHSSGVWRVAWSPNGHRLATAGQDGIVRIFAIDSGGEVAQIPHGLGTSELDALDWSPDGQQNLSSGYDSTLRIRDAERGARLDAIDRLIELKKEHPKDLETLRKLALTYAQVGWVDDARLTFGQVHSLAPDDAASRTAGANAEAAFVRALDTPSLDWMSSPALAADKRRALELLNTVHDSWEGKQPETAITAFRELAHLSGSTTLLPYAYNYVSRARWSVSWFASRTDPLGDLEAWRALAHEPEAVNTTVRALMLPYQSGGPKALNLNPELTERGPGADHYGMIATAKINLPVGKWRFHASGGGGVRVLADGKTVLENWTADAPAEKFGAFETKTSGEVALTVEHFVVTPIPGFQFLIEPVER